ncbi:MAG: hypothetical protein FWH34_06050 [Desulfovibrionaceae bacterium]|nr:hypothetical protein [Desulfovibrionaceae bacterium]
MVERHYQEHIKPYPKYFAEADDKAEAFAAITGEMDMALTRSRGLER